MVLNDLLDTVRENLLLPLNGLLFLISSRVLLHAPFHRQDSTYHGLCYTGHVETTFGLCLSRDSSWILIKVLVFPLI